jgi:hypothetical protein
MNRQQLFHIFDAICYSTTNRGYLTKGAVPLSGGDLGLVCVVLAAALHAALRVPLVRWRVRGTIYWVRELVWGPCFFTANHPFAASGKRIGEY